MTQSKLAELVAKWRGLSSHVPLDDFYADALHACADELEAALSQQPAVDAAMVTRATDAHDAYWQDESLFTTCPECKGEGATPVGIDADRDWCPKCGGTGDHCEGTEEGAMRAALTAAIGAQHEQ